MLWKKWVFYREKTGILISMAFKAKLFNMLNQLFKRKKPNHTTNQLTKMQQHGHGHSQPACTRAVSHLVTL